ncbi:MAG TPA: Calx-beta domain-containing protein, partial [Thermoanaerobaculia bacterium]
GDGTGLFARRFEGPAGGALRLATGHRVLGEGAGFATVRVERLGSADGQVTVEVATTDLPGGARAGLDYEGRFETLVWADGDREPKALEIPVLEDSRREGDERFRVALDRPTGGAGLGEPSAVVFTLLDNDGAGATVDDPFLADLTPGESACDGARLAGLFDRLTIEAPASAEPVGVNLALTASGDFAGLAYTANGPATPEHHLAFSTNPEETPLLRNPARPQLVTVGLARNHLASDLVSPGDPDHLALVLNPTLSADPPSAGLLRIDNLAGAAGRVADAKPGRGLLPLAEPCHGRLGRADVHVLRVLQKVVRAETAGAVRQAVALYPGAEPGTYRIDVYPQDASGQPLGRLAAEVTADFLSVPQPGAPTVLGSGELRVLPACGAAGGAECTDLARETTLHLVRPLFRGLWTPTPYRVTVGPGGPEAPAPAVEVVWGDLLGATTWLAVF